MHLNWLWNNFGNKYSLCSDGTEDCRTVAECHCECSPPPAQPFDHLCRSFATAPTVPQLVAPAVYKKCLVFSRAWITRLKNKAEKNLPKDRHDNDAGVLEGCAVNLALLHAPPFASMDVDTSLSYPFQTKECLANSTTDWTFVGKTGTQLYGYRSSRLTNSPFEMSAHCQFLFWRVAILVFFSGERKSIRSSRQLLLYFPV